MLSENSLPSSSSIHGRRHEVERRGQHGLGWRAEHAVRPYATPSHVIVRSSRWCPLGDPELPSDSRLRRTPNRLTASPLAEPSLLAEPCEHGDFSRCGVTMASGDAGHVGDWELEGWQERRQETGQAVMGVGVAVGRRMGRVGRLNSES